MEIFFVIYLFHYPLSMETLKDNLDMLCVKEIVNESKIASEKLGNVVSGIKDTIIEEAPFDELKNVQERLTPILKETAESFDVESTFEMF